MLPFPADNMSEDLFHIKELAELIEKIVKMTLTNN